MTPTPDTLERLRTLLKEAVDGLSQSACFTCGADPGTNIDCAGCSWVSRAQAELALDVTCDHGTALDVHCCHCHSGFIFDKDHECPPKPQTPDTLRAALEWLQRQRACGKASCGHVVCGYVQDILAALSREAPTPEPATLATICQSEGPRGETICMLPLGHKGPCGWERATPEPVDLAALRAAVDALPGFVATESSAEAEFRLSSGGRLIRRADVLRLLTGGTDEVHS